MSMLPLALRRLYHRLAFQPSQHWSLDNQNRSQAQLHKSSSIRRHYPSSLATSASEAPQSANNSKDDLIISERAVERLKEIASSGEYLRVLVDSGGCSGFEYKFQLVPAPESDDRVFEKDGVRVVVDELSLDFVRGATIDYNVELIKAAFRVVQNPRAEKGCSCGASFALKAVPAPTKREEDELTKVV